jgi:hypothetical protein
VVLCHFLFFFFFFFCPSHEVNGLLCHMLPSWCAVPPQHHHRRLKATTSHRLNLQNYEPNKPFLFTSWLSQECGTATEN